MRGLDKQVYIYSLGTECFYTDKEYEIHKRLLKSFLVKSKIKSKIDKLSEIYKEYCSEVKLARQEKFSKDDITILIRKRDTLKLRISVFRKRNKKVTEYTASHKQKLKDEFKQFEGVRILRNDLLTKNKIIGVFDSVLTRTVGMKIGDTSEDLFIIRAFYFNILEDIIANGFMHNDEKYIYLSSSAGQIRTKKTVFIKEFTWEKHEKSLTCGLSIYDINNKGGCNVNKLLAYKALISSASVKWNDFDIRKTIVVPDLESPVTTIFDYINRDTYEITPKELTVDIEHTDGCGMILPSKSKKSFMVRMPFVKGLLVPFAFDKFINEVEGTSSKIKDIYGKEWDIIEDKIEVIFTKSQFKMAKYYKNWQDYVEKFEKYKCQANKLNEEELGGNATLNYQMLQTLTDITDSELKELCESTNKDIKKIASDKQTILRILGATKDYKYKNHFQQSLLLYPELINDVHSKRIIKDKKKALVDDGRAGKLNINGKYIYLIPDLYAFCEKLFIGIQHPNGLLSNGDVYCSVYNEGKVDVLRSPHLYKEHAIRNVVKSEELSKWFITQGIYTSVHDPISRILQFDNDGDKALVIQDDLFVSIAERNMNGVLPLYYEMEVAPPQIITNKEIYNSLILAFKANIGEVSNNITKIFNSSDEIDLDVVKWLTAENNYIIDFAKTLYMPTRPLEVNERIVKAINGKVPHFFQEAKKKPSKNVAELNDSTVNRLRKIVKNPSIKVDGIDGNFDYKMLMSKNIEYVNRNVVSTYRKLDRTKKWIMRDSSIKDRKEGLLYVYKYIRDELKQIESDETKIVNVLVEELYGRTKSPVKETLWHCFGDILLSNLRENLKGTKQCECCGVRIEIVNNQTKYCESCFEIERKKYKAQKEKEYRLRKRGQLNS